MLVYNRRIENTIENVIAELEWEKLKKKAQKLLCHVFWQGQQLEVSFGNIYAFFMFWHANWKSYILSNLRFGNEKPQVWIKSICHYTKSYSDYWIIELK